MMQRPHKRMTTQSMPCVFLVILSCFIGHLPAVRQSFALPQVETSSQSEDALGKNYEDLEYRYRALRNTDPAFEKRDLWYKLRSDLRTESPKFRASLVEPRFHMLTLLLSQEIGVREGNRGKLQETAQDFQRLAAIHPNHEVAPRALFAAYKILVEHLHDRVTAARVSSMLLKQYPHSEQAYLLRGLEGSLVKREKIGTKYSSRDGRPVIVLDPGHGGEDYGAVGVSGLREKDLTLLIAKLTQEKLHSEQCCTVLLTREADTFVPLFERTEFANRHHAKLFVSLHINAEEIDASDVSRRGARGFEVYSVSQDAKEEAITLVTRENRGSDVPDSSISQFLAELHRRASGTISRPFADAVFQTLKRELPGEYQGVPVVARKASSAPFYVLFGAEMPAILVELFFVSDLDDAFLLGQQDFREQIASALAKGLKDILMNAERKAEDSP